MASHYGPDEPSLREIGTLKAGEDLSENQQRKLMGAVGKDGSPDERITALFGRVFEWFEKLNPDHRPTILFAPGVRESLWFAQEFERRGVSAAHIDGKEVWFEGELQRTTQQVRDEVMAGSKSGKVQVVCNRFVLREGIDAPWLRHGIFATVFGSLQTYLQSGGRLLRAYSEKNQVTVQDHGGCLDTETEVLTARGWVGYKGIRDDDYVAAYDRWNGSIRWEKVLHRHERIIEPGEKMFQLQGRCANFRVTGNHRILVDERVNVGASKVWPQFYDFTRADELAASALRVKIPVAGVQKASGVSLTDDELRFIGWFVTDGCMSGKRQAVSITQADHQPHIADLRACLRGCGFDVRETKRQPNDFSGSQPQTQFHIPKGTGKSKPRKGWWPLRLYLDKNLSRNLELVDERQFGILLHAIHLGDGAKGRNDGSYRISTGNKTFADNLQSLAVRKGWKCNIYTGDNSTRLNPIYVLNMQKVTATTIHGSLAKTSDDQVKLVESPSIPGVTRVWCVANALETLVTRRNGMVAIVGNSWWRHGSLNADRQWRLDDTASSLASRREESQRERLERQPVRCPQCGLILMSLRCPCGYTVKPTEKTRPVIMSDGSLEMHGEAYPQRKRMEKPDTAKLWTTFYCMAYMSKRPMTFKAAEGLFAKTHKYYPPRTLALMPRNAGDWFEKVRRVPTERLNGPPPPWLDGWRRKRDEDGVARTAAQ